MLHLLKNVYSSSSKKKGMSDESDYANNFQGNPKEGAAMAVSSQNIDTSNKSSSNNSAKIKPIKQNSSLFGLIKKRKKDKSINKS